MIGRAAPANPWIFRQIAQYTATGAYDTPTVDDRFRMIRAYFEMLLAETDARLVDPGVAAERSSPAGWNPVGKMKQFATWFTHGVPGGARLRAAIYQARTGTEVLGEVERFFAAAAGESAGPQACVESEDTPPWLSQAELICD